jgi:hypothetical protein
LSNVLKRTKGPKDMRRLKVPQGQEGKSLEMCGSREGKNGERKNGHKGG